MSEQRVVLGMLAAAVVAAAALVLGFRGRAQPPADLLDPAMEHYLQGRSTAFGGVDRWAAYGMSQEAFAVRLQREGFTCPPLPELKKRNLAPGTEEFACTRDVRWPVARRLAVTGGIARGPQPRLTYARAESTVVTAALKPVATLLRKLGWIEPAHLQVRGFEIATPDLLARYAVDAMKGGWAETCALSSHLPVQCAQAARTRRASGFAAVATGAHAPDYDAAVWELSRLRLLRPQWPQALAPVRGESATVRVTDGELWVDFAGQDLAGHELALSLQLAMAGGQPQKLVATVDGAAQELPLWGVARKHNDAPEYLLPQAGPGAWRRAAWLRVPQRGDDWANRRIAAALPQADPRLAAVFIKKLLDTLAQPEHPDMALDLFPALLMVERRAEALRQAGAQRWLPRDVGAQLLRAAYPEHPTLRAAWVLAVCEPAFDAVGTQPDCWQRETELDPDLGRMLRDDLAALDGVYATLPPTHPLQLRLQRWRRLLGS